MGVGLAATPLAAAPIGTAGLPTALELPVPIMERIEDGLWVAALADEVWLTCFTGRIGGGTVYPANGLIVGDGRTSLLIDLGWNRGQGEAMLAHARTRLGRPVEAGVVTHFHSDRSGGLEALRRANIPAFAHPLTIGLARRYGAPEADVLPGFERGTATIDPVELFFPGPGHSPDNIVAWHAPSATLFGGCLIKSVTADAMGNVEDADLDRYDATLAAVAARYGRRARTVPGHGSIADDPIRHTRALLARTRSRSG